MSYYEHGHGGQIIMICQVCGTKHHDEPKQVYVQDQKTKVWRWAKCPLCCCHDCIQLAEDPIRRQLAPGIMGQTINAGERITYTTGKNKEQKKFTEKLPGLFDIQKAISQIPEFGLQAPERRQALPHVAACGCGSEPSVKCVRCEEPLCGQCIKGHKC
jgi:hypothetical protein